MTAWETGGGQKHVTTIYLSVRGVTPRSVGIQAGTPLLPLWPLAFRCKMLLQYWVANFVALESVVMGLGSGCGDEDDTPVACLLCNRCVDKFLCLLFLLGWLRGKRLLEVEGL